MPTLGPLLTAILSQLCAAIGAVANRRAQIPQVVWLGTRAYLPVQPHPAQTIPAALLALACARLNRIAQRLTRLYDRWKSNTLPKTRPSRAGQERSAPKPRLYLPRTRAWLAASTDHHVRGYAAQLNHVLTQPDAKEFIEAVPRAGRLLRPLSHMLGLDLPGLSLPPRPRKPRPKPEKPPAEPARHGKYTVAQARHYSPGRIPEFTPKPT